MNNVVNTFIRQHAFHFGKDTSEIEVCELLCKHVDALVFNVTSLASIVVTLYQSKKLDVIHVPSIRQHIVEKCQHRHAARQRGGRVTMPSDFFGYNHPNYSTANEGSDILGIDLESGSTARPSLGPQSGGGGASVAQTRFMKTTVQQILSKHNIRSSREAFKELLSIIDAQLECLAADMRKCEPLTVKKLERLLTKKKYFVFQ